MPPARRASVVEAFPLAAAAAREIRDMLGEPLLDLGTPCVKLDDAGEFGQSPRTASPAARRCVPSERYQEVVGAEW